MPLQWSALGPGDREGKRVAEGSGRLGESHAMLRLIRRSFCWIPVKLEQSVVLAARGHGLVSQSTHLELGVDPGDEAVSFRERLGRRTRPWLDCSLPPSEEALEPRSDGPEQNRKQGQRFRASAGARGGKVAASVGG